MTDISKRLDEIFIRAGLNPADDETAAQMVSTITQLFLDLIVEAKPEPNPREWAANLPQTAWTIGFENGIQEYEKRLRELLK